MDRIMVTVAIGVALVFAAGVILGFFATISLGSPAASAVRVGRRARPDVRDGSRSVPLMTGMPTRG